ncbi:acetolactate synthase large subunit [Rhodococcus aetherivorans]|uniref:acetolactate synthase n=1 Tax=Rhodococcus aetherivorans TaxID=191292 RepID=A0ABQ0YF81_9NOCA|nr:acetolactate synthase large subunit [Rhodococcus aetherivorans]
MVLVDIPKDVLQARTTFTWPAERQLPGHHVITQPHDKQLRAAADLIATAERPVLYVRGGVIKADASNELRELAEQTGIPVGDHPHGPRRVPDSHRLHYGMPCMHGTVAAVAALQRSDLLIALGARFDDRVTGDPASFAPHARVIHVDIDPGRDRQAPLRRRTDRRRLQDNDQLPDTPHPRPPSLPSRTRSDRLVRRSGPTTRHLPPRLHPPAHRRSGARTRHRCDRTHGGPGRDLRLRSRTAPDVGRTLHHLRQAPHLAQLRRPRHHGLRRSRRTRRQTRHPGSGGLGDRR